MIGNPFENRSRINKFQYPKTRGTQQGRYPAEQTAIVWASNASNEKLSLQDNLTRSIAGKWRLALQVLYRVLMILRMELIFPGIVPSV